MPLEKSIGKAVDNLMKWASQPKWESFLHDTYMFHFYTPNDLFELVEELFGEDLYEFLDTGPGLMARISIMEDFLQSRFGEDGELNPVDDFLKRRGWRESVPARRYLESFRDSQVSLYEVIEVHPGQSLVLRDLIQDNRTVTVDEVEGSKQLAVWDGIVTRIVPHRNKSYIFGSVLPFNALATQALLEHIEFIKKEYVRMRRKGFRKKFGRDFEVPKITDQAILKKLPLANILLEAWILETLQAMYAPRPQLRNYDGDLIELCEVHFPIKGNGTDIAGVLEHSDTFAASDDGNVWQWYGETKFHESSAEFAPDMIDMQSPLNVGATVDKNIMLGVLRLDSTTLILETNSVERAERGQAYLAGLLGSLVGPSLISHQQMDRALDEYAAHSTGEPIAQTEEMMEMAHAYHDEHYRETLDTPLPMLDGKTLRQAAKSKKHRKDAIAWLKQLENMESKNAIESGMKPYDTAWIWEELNLKPPEN